MERRPNLSLADNRPGRGEPEPQPAQEGATGPRPDLQPDPPDGDDVVQDDPLPDALEELIEILGDGLKAEVIGQEDVDLLLAVMDAAAQLVPPSGPGIGITGDRVSARIGELHGCSPRTIRRRIKRSTDALGQLAQEQQSA